MPQETLRADVTQHNHGQKWSVYGKRTVSYWFTFSILPLQYYLTMHQACKSAFVLCFEVGRTFMFATLLQIVGVYFFLQL